MKKKIFYWGPFLDNVATVTAILNSSKSINKYSKNFSSKIINAIGEWNNIEKEKLDNLEIKNLNMNFYEQLPRYSFIKSRLSYLIIFLRSFFPLKKLLKDEKPDFLIIHLIVSLPMILFIFFKFDTKLCLRISGKPQLNIFRTILWKICSKKIHKVFCPTQETIEVLNKKNIFNGKLFLLQDPVLNVSKITKLKNEKVEQDFKKNNIILIGRHTKQKNFQLFVNAFSQIEKKFPNLKAYIFGEGELKDQLKKHISDLNLMEKIFLKERTNNIFKYIKNSKYFILTSLWEDPGFVLIESAFCDTTIISSNCPSGPKEFLENGNGGYLYENNSINSLVSVMEEVFISNDEKKKIKKKNAKLRSRNYSSFKHFLTLENLLS